MWKLRRHAAAGTTRQTGLEPSGRGAGRGSEGAGQAGAGPVGSGRGQAPGAATGVTESDAPAMSDEAALVARYAKGDAEAARELAEALLPPARTLAWRLLGDLSAAEAVAQDAMLGLWKAAPDWHDGCARVSLWLDRVVVDLCAARCGAPRPAHAPPPPGPAIAAPASSTARRAAICQCGLATLPERARAALVLRDVEGRADHEVATLLGRTIEAADELAAHGRGELRAWLATLPPEPGTAPASPTGPPGQAELDRVLAAARAGPPPAGAELLAAVLDDALGEMIAPERAQGRPEPPRSPGPPRRRRAVRATTAIGVAAAVALAVVVVLAR